MGTLDDHPRFVGYYTQPYNDIIQAKQIWHVSKYLLRRWGPYLSPARFWAVVAAQQLAYWNNKADWFTAYDGQMAQAAQVSCVHYRRIKVELNDRQNPISLFLTRGKTEYHVVDGQTRPKPTVYRVRLDDPLTPADAHHLTTRLQAEELPRRANEVAACLHDMLRTPRHELLPASVGPFLADSPAQFLPLTVQDVVSRVFGGVAQQESVRQQAESLHRYLTQPEYIGKQYFRRRWLPALKAGPAYLISYLRSLCYDNEMTGERRDQITFTRPELAGRLGITTKTLASWLRKLEKATVPQPLPPFLTLIDKQRVSSNDVAYTYQVALNDPLTEPDLAVYSTQMAALTLAAEGKNEIHAHRENRAPAGKNEIHAHNGRSLSVGKNDDHDTPVQVVSEGINEIHKKGFQSSSEGINEIHEVARKEKMIRGEVKNDQGSEKKRASFKYYQILYQLLMSDRGGGTTFDLFVQATAWQTANGHAEQTVARAAAKGSLSTLFDLMEVDVGSPARLRVEQGRLNLDSIAAWYLHARQQEGLDNPVAFTIKRTAAGWLPPPRYLKLATLSWELWRCYGALLLLPPRFRDAFRDAPEYSAWMKEYGRCHPDDLPFGVGAGLAEEIPALLHGWAEPACGRTNLPEMVQATVTPHQHLWDQVLSQLQLAMNRIAFQTWLASSRLLQVQQEDAGQRWTVALDNEQAVDWVDIRVNKSVIEPLATAIYGQGVTINYCVDIKHDSHSHEKATL